MQVISLWNFHSGNTDCTAQKWTVWDTSAPSTSSRWSSQLTWKQEYHSYIAFPAAAGAAV
ncbi:hypothetical protein ACFU8Q_39720 [Streptomyces sp. NPDC057543]|uniref:hypothetical protein n=1 Tax=Streptomyces sp. NPDC057543 TaxID=3346163 RepID=UPI0036821792